MADKTQSEQQDRYNLSCSLLYSMLYDMRILGFNYDQLHEKYKLKDGEAKSNYKTYERISNEYEPTFNKYFQDSINDVINCSVPKEVFDKFIADKKREYSLCLNFSN